jgi:hypothetical protein
MFLIQYVVYKLDNQVFLDIYPICVLLHHVKFKPALDPDDILNDEEEHILDKCLKRLGYLIYKQHTVLKT